MYLLDGLHYNYYNICPTVACAQTLYIVEQGTPGHYKAPAFLGAYVFASGLSTGHLFGALFALIKCFTRKNAVFEGTLNSDL